MKPVQRGCISEGLLERGDALLEIPLGAGEVLVSALGRLPLAVPLEGIVGALHTPAVGPSCASLGLFPGGLEPRLSLLPLPPPFVSVSTSASPRCVLVARLCLRANVSSWSMVEAITRLQRYRGDRFEHDDTRVVALILIA